MQKNVEHLFCDFSLWPMVVIMMKKVYEMQIIILMWTLYPRIIEWCCCPDNFIEKADILGANAILVLISNKPNTWSEILIENQNWSTYSCLVFRTTLLLNRQHSIDSVLVSKLPLSIYSKGRLFMQFWQNIEEMDGLNIYNSCLFMHFCQALK